MALLTAEDVLNKAFSKTKYREGFDQDEVDDFLDEVANTIAQLTAERDELAAQVANGVPAATPAVETPPVTAAGGVPGTTGLLAAATEPGAVNPTGMLAMAQKLHDEYVQAGEAERDRIIAEAHTSADEIRERADGDAKARMDALAGERAELEGRIDDLRRFERDYRARLKQYLENLLGDLDHSGGVGTAAAAGFAAGGLAELGGDAAPGEPAPAASTPADSAPENAAPADSGTEWPAGDQSPAAEPAAEEAPSYGGEGTEDAAADASEQGEVHVQEFEPAAPVSFEEAVGGFAQPEAETPATQEQPPAPPSYDATQPWEAQLRPEGESTFVNPFAPVSEPAAPAQEGEAVPPVDAAEETEEAPYTPPSSRMFTDLYGQQRPESGN